MPTLPPDAQPATRPRRSRRGLWFLFVILLVCLVVVWRLQSIVDYIKLYHYQPPAAVASLADQTSMTPAARHLFYLNHPAIEDRKAFNQGCKAYGEHTIVLGCYHGNENGIYLFEVSDKRLQGVEQVTAAHEMLHAAYERLSSQDKKSVNAMLMDFYEHDLTDQRVKDTIAAYKKSEPDQLVNEMHSVFGTEVAQLPAPLEQYYRRYFTDRSKVTTFAANYQAEFTSRTSQVAADDARLKNLKSQIDGNRATLAGLEDQLASQRNQLDQLRTQGDSTAYNAGVPTYNTQVDRYNNLVAETQQLIAEYNQLVGQRNAIALEVNQLAQAINSKPQPITTQ